MRVGQLLRHHPELGYFARGDHVNGTRTRLQADTSGNPPYKIDADLESKIGDIGLYADANLRPLSWLTLRGGLRGDGELLFHVRRAEPADSDGEWRDRDRADL